MNFVNAVTGKYQIYSYHTQLEKMINEAEKEISRTEDELKKLRAEYSKLVADENSTEELLLTFEKKIEEAEADWEKATKDYDTARHTTLQDLKDEHAYETWKENR
jgi:septal ring factor EnvC (AmiA/AmiB activator)